VTSLFKASSEWEVLGLGNSRAKGDVLKVDLLDFAAMQKVVESFRPDVIVHTAAERRFQVCEEDKERSRKLNVEVTKQLAILTKKIGGWLLYISTDYLFDGTNPPYAESAKPNPLNEYGRQKRDAGRAAREHDWGCGVLRVPLLYGKVETLNESGVSAILKMILEKKPAKLDHWQVFFDFERFFFFFFLFFFFVSRFAVRRWWMMWQMRF
jgi:S-adenosylmethionine synthetase